MISMAHYFLPIVKYTLSFSILWRVSFCDVCNFWPLFSHFFFLKLFITIDDQWRGFARSDGRRKINKRYRSALAAHWSASSQEKRIGSVAARCVASRRAATERECDESDPGSEYRLRTLVVLYRSSPLRSFPSRSSAPYSTVPFSPFRDCAI